MTTGISRRKALHLEKLHRICMSEKTKTALVSCSETHLKQSVDFLQSIGDPWLVYDRKAQEIKYNNGSTITLVIIDLRR